jgi:hypothetical protein
MAPSDLVAYIDVDDTLVRSFGSKRIPIPAVIQHVRDLHHAGVVLYCWSSGGAKYAEDSARELGLFACFLAFLPKPNVVVDDMAFADWPNLIRVHPNEAMSKSAVDYATELSA